MSTRSQLRVVWEGNILLMLIFLLSLLCEMSKGSGRDSWFPRDITIHSDWQHSSHGYFIHFTLKIRVQLNYLLAKWIFMNSKSINSLMEPWLQPWYSIILTEITKASSLLHPCLTPTTDLFCVPEKDIELEWNSTQFLETSISFSLSVITLKFIHFVCELKFLFLAAKCLGMGLLDRMTKVWFHHKKLPERFPEWLTQQVSITIDVYVFLMALCPL